MRRERIGFVLHSFNLLPQLTAAQNIMLPLDLAGRAALLSLLSLTVIVAVVGVGTTTSLSVVERVREAGLLRAVGLSRPVSGRC